ncbi:MAG: cysteine-rich CWC family protein [Burkholderiales bacterium]|nr:cysteine-rich CWC family protein [Bacteroidia bacterium]
MQNSSKNNKTCERCQQPFICNPLNIATCGCTQVYLTPEILSYVAAQYSDCVCNTCLLHLKDEFLNAK